MPNGRYYTITFSEQELDDVIDALPGTRPHKTASSRVDRQFGLRTDLSLKRMHPDTTPEVLEGVLVEVDDE